MVFNKIGVVICGEIGANIAGIVFCDHEEPLYILPRSLFIIQQSELMNLSKTQRAKRERIPSVGENIEFNARHRLISDFAPTIVYREVSYSRDGLLQIKTSCVLSSETPIRRCWSKVFGFVDLSEKYTESLLLSNVAYQCSVDIVLELGVIAQRADDREFIDLRAFQPQYYPRFGSFDGVELNDSLIREAPWNRNQPLVINPVDDGDQFDILELNAGKEYGDSLCWQRCLMMEANDLFCAQKPGDVCKIGLPYQRNALLLPGCQLFCNMYYCRFNNLWIAYAFTHCNTEKFPTQYLNDDEGTLIVLVPLRRHHELPSVYYNDFSGNVADPDDLLRGKAQNRCCQLRWSNQEEVFRVWVRRVIEPVQNNCYFVVAKLAYSCRDDYEN